MRKVFLYLVVSFFVLNSQFFILNSSAGVRWGTNGVSAVTTGNVQSGAIASDGANGVIVVWSDIRNDANGDIYAVRIDSSGSVASGWTTDGIVICNAPAGTGNSTQTTPAIVSDGSGGAIISWQDNRNDTNGDIYAVRISSSGSVVSGWTANGTLVCNASNAQTGPVIASDGSGGAIISWIDKRSDSNGDIYAVRLNSSGSVVSGWTSNGTVVCNAPAGSGNSTQSNPLVVSDGTGGAVFAWLDNRNDTIGDVYAVRLDSSGSVVSGWTSNGTLVCNATGASSRQNVPQMISDGASGAIITWRDERNETSGDIYGVRMTSSGSVASGWTSNGTAICTTSGYAQQTISLSSNGLGGAIVSWRDSRSGSLKVYAQLISSSGVMQWDSNGKLISPTTIGYGNGVTYDGVGGGIVAWTPATDVMAQRIDSAGNFKWGASGITAAVVSISDEYVYKVISDETGGGIIFWRHLNNDDSTYDLYVQRVSNDVPTVVNISPSSANSTGSISATITGTNFFTGATVKLTKSGQSDISGTSVSVVSDTQITCNFDLTGKASGKWSITVLNTDGQSGSLTDGIGVDAPTVANINPNSGSNTSVDLLEITDLRGTGFVSGGTVKLTKTGETDITASSVNVVSSSMESKITCKFDLLDKALGKWNVVIINPDGQSVSLANGFEIKKEIAQAIDHKRGKSITAKGPKGQIRLLVPVDTFNKSTTLNINTEPSLPLGFQSSTEYKATNIGVEINTSDTNLGQRKSITLKIEYRDIDIIGMNEKNLVIAYYNTKTSKWEALPSRVSMDDKEVIATLPHFSLYQIMEYFRQISQNDIKVYPNPFTPKASDSRFNQVTFKFENTNYEEVEIKIWDITGRQVRVMKENGVAIIIWDGKDEWGNIVEAGVYVYQLKVGNGVVKKGTLVCAK